MPYASLLSAIRHAALLLSGLLALALALHAWGRLRGPEPPGGAAAKAYFDGGAVLRFLPSPFWLVPEVRPELDKLAVLRQRRSFSQGPAGGPPAQPIAGRR